MTKWINCKERLPEYLPNESYSANVWGWDGHNILIVALVEDGGFWYWANAYGDVFGDAELDDDYQITHWAPINIPSPPGTGEINEKND